jgi:hypothetical protein
VLRRDLPLRFAYPAAATLCGPCWARFGGQAAAGEIGPMPDFALPVRNADNPTEWAAVFRTAHWLPQLRRDARDKVLALVSGLRNWADWSTSECWPTWARLCELSGWARSTLAAWLRQLWIIGWIDRIEPGSTPQHRPMGSPRQVEGNRAAVYGLRVPAYAERLDEPQRQREAGQVLTDLTTTLAQLNAAEGKTWTPSLSFDLDNLRIELGHLRTRARELVDNVGGCPEVEKIEPLRGRFDGRKRTFRFSDLAPVRRAEMLVAAAELQLQHPVAARLSPRAIRSVCRVYWRAGWSNRDVLWALRYQPTGWAALSSLAEYAVIHPAGWVRSRLSTWRDERGRVLSGRGELAWDQQEPRITFACYRENYGLAGAKLLVSDRFGQLDTLVAEHGRRCAEQLAGERRADQARQRAVAEATAELERQRAARRAAVEKTALQRQLVEQARAHTAVEASPAPVGEREGATAAVDGDVLSPAERVARARARAAGEGHGTRRFGFLRRRW